MKLKKVLCLLLACLLTLSLAACGEKKESKEVKIFIGVQQLNDPTTIAMENILDALTTELNFTYEVGLLNSRNSVENLNTFNNKIAMGYNGVISMADLDVEQAEELIDTCEAAGAYYVGFMSDMANAMRSEKVKNSPYFLGGSSDGELDWSLRAERLFNVIKDSDDRKIVLASFKAQYFPQVEVAINKFKSLVEEYNAANPNDQFTYAQWPDGTDTWACPFSACPEAYLAALKEQSVDAIVGINCLAKYIMPSLDESINLYNVGYDPTYDAQFGKDKQLRCEGATPADHILLPLIRIINAVNGAEPIDVDKKVSVGNYIYLTSEEDLATCKASLINFTAEHAFTDALFTVDQAKKLVGAPDGELTALTTSWTTENVLKK